MKIDSMDFRVRPGDKVKLTNWATMGKPCSKTKEQYQELLREHVEKLSSLQQLHYAANRYALLPIFQGMDVGGKDGAIRHVMSGVNPQGCLVFSFKQPSADQLEHDFLLANGPDRCFGQLHSLQDALHHQYVHASRAQ